MAEATQSIITNVPPSYYGQKQREPHIWLDLKRKDDNVEDGLWRIDNTLYDLNDFIKKHPGGSEWIKITKGHDITEAFYSHHLVTEKLQPYLKQYRVKETTRPRNVKLTFKEDGFYMTLRRRVAEKLPEIKKNNKIYSKFYVDGLFIMTLLTAIFAQRFQSITLALLCSLLMTWTGVCGHNYFHQRDNYRMIYFNIIFNNYREWRVSHVLSHHLYPNSLLDMELLMLEPFLVWVPSPNAKNWIQRYVSYIYSPILWCFVYIVIMTKRIYNAILRSNMMHIDEFLPFVIPIVMYLFGGDNSIGSALKLFVLMTMAGSFMFVVIGGNAGHHHPQIVHDGDAIRKELDWGLYSVDTVMEREEIQGSPFLSLTNFGDHALHHLFPTLDHGLLTHLYDIFYETLMEFEAECQSGSWFEAIKGQFQQLTRIETMKLDPHERYLLKTKKSEQRVSRQG